MCAGGKNRPVGRLAAQLRAQQQKKIESLQSCKTSIQAAILAAEGIIGLFLLYVNIGRRN